MIRFPAKWSRYYEPDYEPETFRFFREKLHSGDTFLDIGAHIGLFAVLGARIVGPQGRVFSFEPTPFTRSVLQDMVALNGCGDVVEVRGEAVSEKEGETVFFDTGDEISNANSLVRTERSRNEIPVKMIAVDQFVDEKGLTVNCLKIDVEGAEIDVLRGAKNTFEVQRPVARLGLHPPFIKQNGQSLEEIWDLIEGYRYKVEYDEADANRNWFCSQPELFDVNLLPVD